MGRHRRRKTTRRSVTAARIAVGGLVLTGAATGFAKVSAEVAPPPQLKAQVQEHRVLPVVWVAPQDRPALPSADYVPADYATDPSTSNPAPADPSTDPGPVSNDPADLFDHYVVQPGDTLTHIAAAYGIPWQAMWSANSDRLPHPDMLFCGEVLRLPF